MDDQRTGAQQALRPQTASRAWFRSLSAVERLGIQYIPDEQRWAGSADLFWMWTGAVWNVEFIVFGGLTVALFGLSLTQASIVIVLGNLTYVLTGLASLQGPVTGTTTFMINRVPFGRRGGIVPSFFNWMTLVGFEALGLSLIVLAAQALLPTSFSAHAYAAAVLLILAIFAQLLAPLLGHAAIVKTLRALAIPFVLFFIVMAANIVPRLAAAGPANPAGWGQFLVALALIMSSGGLGWTTNANDYSRYLPASTSRARIIVAVALGGAIPSILLEFLGAAVAALSHSPISLTGIASLTSSWLSTPYLIFAIVQILAINSVLLYSSGLTLQNITPALSRIRCIIIDVLVSGVLAALAIFSARFSTWLSDFLLFIIVWISPWFAIYIVDYWLRAGKYDQGLLFSGPQPHRSSAPRRFSGIIAQFTGMLAALLWLNAYSPYVSPLSHAFQGSDLSAFMGALFGGGSYWLLNRRSARQPGSLTRRLSRTRRRP